MATSVKLTQVRGVVTSGSIEEAAGGVVGQYFVTSTCSEAEVDGVPSPSEFNNSFFLFKWVDPGDDTYEHVCTVGDLEAYHDIVPTDPYYRLTTATLFFDDLDDAWTAANLIKSRLQNLVDDWENYVNNSAGSFAGTDVVTYSS